MRISYAPDKRQKTLDERGLDFEDAPEVFSGLTFEVEDTRRDYGEMRMICFGYLVGAWSSSAIRQEEQSAISSA